MSEWKDDHLLSLGALDGSLHNLLINTVPHLTLCLICSSFFLFSYTYTSTWISAVHQGIRFLFCNTFLKTVFPSITFVPQTLNTCSMPRKLLLKPIYRLCLKLFSRNFLRTGLFYSSCPLTNGKIFFFSFRSIPSQNHATDKCIGIFFFKFTLVIDWSHLVSLESVSANLILQIFLVPLSLKERSYLPP